MSIIEKIKSIGYYFVVALIVGLSWYGYYATNLAEERLRESERNENNKEYYKSLYLKGKDNGNALQLRVDELENTNDSIIKEMLKIKGKKGGIGKSKPGDIVSGGTISVDTGKTISIVNPKKFELDTTIVFNNMTESRIKIDSIGLTNELKIKSGFYFEVGSRLVYKNERKNWFDRLIHLDYKKKAVTKYFYKFNNDVIKQDDLRVIVLD